MFIQRVENLNLGVLYLGGGTIAGVAGGVLLSKSITSHGLLKLIAAIILLILSAGIFGALLYAAIESCKNLWKQIEKSAQHEKQKVIEMEVIDKALTGGKSGGQITT